MAVPDRDTVYTREDTRAVYTREGSGTGWFIGIIVALALLAIGYMVFSAGSTPSSTTDINVTTPPAIQTTPADPITTPAPHPEAPAPMTSAPATDAPVLATPRPTPPSSPSLFPPSRPP
jgi:hypothetical protein